MTVEKQLINKTYYETLMEENTNAQPIQVLGELYSEEQKQEMPELSSIRFAQGEIYFQNKDYEAAIFKWENVSDELKPWATKNIADAHLEIDLLAIAEDYYKEVETDSDVLKTEVLLQLFSLYIQRDKLELAVESIKKAVDLNPDYPDVTDMARSFFEKQHDWDNAVALAINEAIRTESLSWFKVVESYVEAGHTTGKQPNYFKQALVRLFSLNQARFESLSAALWNSYKHTDMYFTWLEEYNKLFLVLKPEDSYVWRDLPLLYEETYLELTNREMLIEDFSYLIPNHLTNWLKVSATSDPLVSSAAVLAWNELFPSAIDEEVVSKAENLLKKSGRNHNGVEDGSKLLTSLLNWAEYEGFSFGEQFQAMVRELLDVQAYNLMVAGPETAGKTTFLNTLLNERLVEDSTSATILFKDAEEAEIQVVSNNQQSSVSDSEAYRQAVRIRDNFIKCRRPVSFLQDHKLGLIHSPLPVAGRHAHLADGLLFVMNADSHLTFEELDKAVKIKEQAPDLPIHFLLCQMDWAADYQQEAEMFKTTTERIYSYFPNANVFSFRVNDRKNRLAEASEMIWTIIGDENQEKIRAINLLYFVNKAIQTLRDRRTEMEDSYVENIKWNDEIVVKLKGAQHQLSDMEEEKARVVKKSYKAITDDLRKELNKKIPELLKNCSKLVNEKSDFNKIHIELNEEMNKRIADYLEDTALPNFRTAIQGWIVSCEGQFNDSQAYLHDISESFNQLYGEEKITLDCDFKVLNDWRRDVDRMTRGSAQPEKVNIITNSDPTQFLWKSAGRLFGAFSQNDMIHSKYKQFIENKDYSAVTQSITDQFMQQFELFEKYLERDISMFFKNPNEELERTLEEALEDIEKNRNALNEMREHPETQLDPLKLFELRHRQYEWMEKFEERIHEYQ
ncbi:GTP-binding protein [Sediminibacillus massiliensis]|uniref:GTP-binding protein n=1 Tax=Sediminibacillus massiliensis TaxID=1926277 RepID=UPI0009888B88|nr:GTP-binding protein [Sediminibacillus massiliensis]